jgi:nitrate/nitrite-specific signal transduction histidine kinase
MRANNTVYKKVVKPLKRLREIEEKLEKGHLTKGKVDELLNEYDALEKEMKDTHEYRLYAFKKKRGMKIF